jgi:hypothetical protein
MLALSRESRADVGHHWEVLWMSPVALEQQ